MLWNHISDIDVPSGGSCCHHIGSRLDLIRYDRVFTAMKALHTTDTDGIRTGTFYIGTHTVQKVGHINNVRLLGRIFENCLSPAMQAAIMIFIVAPTLGQSRYIWLPVNLSAQASIFPL